MMRALSLLVSITLPLAAACGGAAQPAPASASPEASQSAPTAAGDQTSSADQQTPLADTAPPAALPEQPEIERRPRADTPMCRALEKIARAAPEKFSSITADQLPGASSCQVIAGGPGESAAATYTCEYASAEKRALLEPKHRELTESIRECGARQAIAATRVRIVRAGDSLHLVVNVHDHARWR